MLYKIIGDYMTKHFKTKSKLRKDILLKFIFIVIISILVIKLCLNIFLKTPILEYTFSNDKVNKYKSYLINNTINKPKYLLKYYVEEKKEDNDIILPVTYIINDKPLVYIYNTHQREAYSNSKTVLDASFYFEKVLNKKRVDTIVEERNITEFMLTNNIDYSYSYYASSFFIKDMLSKHKIDLLIDLHRDALDKSKSTYVGKKNNYAKIMFVIGGVNKKYKKNYKIANDINNRIYKKYPKICRGIIVKTGKNVNGIYNQNIAKNIILIEIGGNNNTFKEVKNTIDLIGPIIGDYLYEQRKSF